MKKPVKILLFGTAGGILVVGGLLSWAASDSFFRSQVLARASTALGTPVRAGGVDWAPTSGLQLNQLTIGEGESKLLTADKVKLSWNLMPLLSKRLEVNEVTLSQAEIFIALDAEGNPKNLPKIKAGEAKDEPAKKDAAPSSPPNFCIKAVKLDRCKLTVTRDGAPGQPGSSVTVKDFSLDLPLLSPGQDFHLAIAAALSSEGQGLGLKLEKCGLKIHGGLSADLKPIGIKIEGELSGMSTTGKGMPDLSGRRFVGSGGVDFKDGKLDLGKDGLLFKEELRGVSGASLLLAGSLDTVKKEGEIRCEVRKVGASLLGLAAPFVSSSKGWQMWQKSLQDAGAPAGFGETDISYTGSIVLNGAAPLQAKGEFVLDNLPVVIGKGGHLQASAASVHFNHDLSFNQAAKSLELRTLGASVSVGNQELLSLVLPKPCGLDLNTGRLSGDGASIGLEMKNFDLALVAPLAQNKDFALHGGRINIKALIAAAADGKIESSVKGGFSGLSFKAGEQEIKDLSLLNEFKATLTKDQSVDIPQISSEAQLAGKSIFTFKGHASKNAAGLLETVIDKMTLDDALTQLLPAKITEQLAIENFNLALEDGVASFDSKTQDASFSGSFLTRRCTVQPKIDGKEMPAVTLSQFLAIDVTRKNSGAISLKKLIFGLESRQGLDSLMSCKFSGTAEIPAEAFAPAGFKAEKVSADFLLENLAVQPVVRNFLPAENLQKPRFANLNFNLPKLKIAFKNGVADLQGGFASKRLIVRNPAGEDKVFANTGSDFAARFNLAEKHFFLDAFKLSFTPSTEIAPLQISAKADVNVGDLAAAGNRVDVEFPAELELAPWIELLQSMLPPQTEKKITVAQAPAKAAAPATSVAVNEPAKPLNCAITFKAPRILYKRQGLEQIALDAALTGDELKISNFSFASEGKPFKVTALLNKGARKSLDMKVDGSIDLSLAQAGLKAVGKDLDIAGVLQLNGVNITAAGKDNDELTQSLVAAGKILLKVDRLQGEVAPGTRFVGLESLNLEVAFSGQAGSASAEGYFAPSHVKVTNAAVKPLDLDGRIDFKANVLSNGVVDLVRCDGKLSLAETVKDLVFKVNARLDPSFKTTSVAKLVMPETFNLRPLMDLQVKNEASDKPAAPAPESTPAPAPGPAAPVKDLPPFRFTANIAGMPDIKLEKIELELETKGRDIRLIHYSHAGTKRPFSASGLITLGDVLSFKDLKLDGPLDFGIANSFVNYGKKTSISGIFDFTQSTPLSGSGKTPYELLNSMKGDIKGTLIEPLELVGYTNLPTLIPELKITGVDFAVDALTDLNPSHMVFESGGFDLSFDAGTLRINQFGLKGKSIMYDTRGSVTAQNNQWLIDLTPNPGYRSSAKINAALDVARAAGDVVSIFGNNGIKKGLEKFDKFNLDDVFALSEKTGMRHLITPFVFKSQYDASLPMEQLISKIKTDSSIALGKVILQSWSDVSARKSARKQAEKAAQPAGEVVAPTPQTKEEGIIDGLDGLINRNKKKPAPAPAPKVEDIPAPEPAPAPAPVKKSKREATIDALDGLINKGKKKPAPVPDNTDPVPPQKDEPPPAKKEEPKKEEPVKEEKSDVEQIIDLFGKKKKKK